MMKYGVTLLVVAAAAGVSVSASAQSNAGGYMPIPPPPPPVTYQSRFAPPGAYGAPGTYVYQTSPPVNAYRAPNNGYGNQQGGGWHNGWDNHRRW